MAAAAGIHILRDGMRRHPPRRRPSAEPVAVRPSPGRRVHLAVLAAFAVVFGSLVVHSSRQKSATWDEPIHVAAGYAGLARGDHRLDATHPQLVRLWAAIPLLAGPPLLVDMSAVDRLPGNRFTDARTERAVARGFLYDHQAGDRALNAARFMITLLAIGLGALLYLWTNAWLGWRAALWALAFFTLTPNIIAHAGLVTTDIGATTFMFGAVYFLWRLSRDRTRGAIAGLALCTAFAIASKFSGLIVVPILSALMFGLVWRGTLPVRAAAGIGAIVAAVTLVVLWAVYGFRYAPGPSSEWLFGFHEDPAVQRAVPWLAAGLGWIDRLGVLPNAYTQGLLALAMSTVYVNTAYLLGEYSSEGWWYYYPIAFLVKTPLALVVLAATGAVIWARRRARAGSDAAFVVVPVAVYAGVALTSTFNIGVRHLLPVMPFVIIVAAIGAEALVRAGRRGQAVLGGLAAIWLVSVASVYPHVLTFFSLAAGGPGNGPAILADSNIDWGQDLKPLKAWLDRTGVAHVNLAYFGEADPEYYGIRATYLPGSPEFTEPLVARPALPGFVAISATVLSGVYLPDRWRLFYAGFRDREPVVVIGNSIRVYWVDEWPPSDQHGAWDPIVHLRLADSLARLKWPDHAVRHYERYLGSHPQDAAVLGRFGVALMQIGQVDRGVEALERAAALDPTNPILQQNLATALSEAGR
jgi:hypothetical protein